MAADGADATVEIGAGWTPAEFEALVRAGESAPRVPGARPWWPALDDNAVTLRTTGLHGRAAGVVGVRETRICAGAGLLGMRLLVAAHGRRPFVRLLPDPARPEVLAVLRRSAREAARPPDWELSALLGPIPTGGPSGAALPAVRYALRRAAAAEAAWLRTATDRGELPGLGVRARAGCTVTQAALYAVLGGDGDVPVAQLRVGQALHRVLLTAARLGLPGRVLAGPADLLPPEGRRLDGRTARPQVLLGLG